MKNMKMKELIVIAKDLGITFKIGTKKDALIEQIEAAQKPKPEPKKAAKKPKLYWYEFIYRGFSPGAQPKGFVKHDENMGGKFGSIAYDRKLTDEEIESFELKTITTVKKSAPKKFSDDEIRFIRESVASKTHSKKHLADQFNTSWNTIHYIVIGKFYSNVA
jgi:hypothetical protein